MYNIFKQYKQINNYLRMQIKTEMCNWNVLQYCPFNYLRFGSTLWHSSGILVVLRIALIVHLSRASRVRNIKNEWDALLLVEIKIKANESLLKEFLVGIISWHLRGEKNETLKRIILYLYFIHSKFNEIF